MANTFFHLCNLFFVYMPVYQPWAQKPKRQIQRDSKNLNMHRESLLPSSKTWTHAGIGCCSNKRPTTKIDLFHSTGRLQQPPLAICMLLNCCACRKALGMNINRLPVPLSLIRVINPNSKYIKGG